MAGLEADVGAARREARDVKEEKAAMAAQHERTVQVGPWRRSTSAPCRWGQGRGSGRCRWGQGIFPILLSACAFHAPWAVRAWHRAGSGPRLVE